MAEEYLELYDENRVSLNKTILRTEDLKEKITEGYYLLAVIIIENNNKEFLLQKTSHHKDSEIALTGGHVKAGHTTLECIISETKEELGININKEDITLFQSFKTKNQLWDVFYLKKDINLDDLIYQKEEVEYAKYFTIEEIKQHIKDKTMRKSTRSILLDYLIKNKD